MSFIPYGRQDISQEDIDAVVDILRSDFLTQGPTVYKFEQCLAEYCGAKYAVVNSIKNACFIRAQIELIEFLFSENEVSEVWITFPDPQIKIQRQKHRLTNINFLNSYKKIIKPKGIIHLKTDSEFLHGYTLGLIEALIKFFIFFNSLFSTFNSFNF